MYSYREIFVTESINGLHSLSFQEKLALSKSEENKEALSEVALLKKQLDISLLISDLYLNGLGLYNCHPLNLVLFRNVAS